MTRVFGVMGFPINHSLSPVMHNAAFKALGLDAIYAPFEASPAKLSRVLRGLLACGIEGLNVTVPLKETVVPFVDAMAQEAKDLAAVNTIVVQHGQMIGYNTDVIGFIRALEELGWRHRPCRAVILGAGGAAKAVAWALTRDKGTSLTIANRHIARAKRLARWLTRQRPWCRIQAQSLERIELHEQELLVNATPVGMRARDGWLIDRKTLHRSLTVYDLVYHRTTPLVQEAQRRGCLAANGLSMLVYQGAESFRLWCRRSPPIAVMRQAVEQTVHSPQTIVHRQ